MNSHVAGLSKINREIKIINSGVMKKRQGKLKWRMISHLQ